MVHNECFDNMPVLREEYRELVTAKAKIDVLAAMHENDKYVSVGDVKTVLGANKKEEDK